MALYKRNCISCGKEHRTGDKGQYECVGCRRKVSKSQNNMSVRELIYKRDGYLCYYCGIHLHNLKSSNICLDHIYPKSLGGLDTTSNLVTSCMKCNQKKSAKLDIDLINKALKDINSRNERFGIDSTLKVWGLKNRK